MKILHVITGLNGGGAQYFLLRLLPYLLKEHRCEVISLSQIGPIGEKIEALGVPVHALDMHAGILPAVSSFFELRRLIKASQADVVHTWLYHSDLLGGLAARSLGKHPVLWAIHSPDVDRRYIKGQTRLVARACSLLSRYIPNTVVSCSEDAWLRHARFGYRPYHVEVIPNGFDVSNFQPDKTARADVRDEIGVSADTPLVGLIARFNEQKGHKDFCTIAKNLAMKVPNVHFLLAGREVTNDNKALVRWLKESEILDRTHLVGARDDVPRVLSSLDVLVSPSLGEAFPLIVGEAMACGTPCVATDVGDTKLIIGDAGIVTTPGNLGQMSAALEHLLTLRHSDKERLSRAAREHIVNNFELSLISRRYIEAYEKTLSFTHGLPSLATDKA